MNNEPEDHSRLLSEIEKLRRLHAESEAAGSACKMAEEALRESEMRFRSVAHSAVDAIISINSKDEITFWNQAAQAIFGYSEEEVLGKPVTLLIPERYRGAHSRGVKRYIETSVPALIGKTKELQGLRKDGGEFPLELSLSTWRTKQGTFFTGIIRDISQRKEAQSVLQQRTEEARQRSQELESLIQMVAHDLKSPVISIAGLVRLLRKELGGKALDGNLGKILDQLTTTSKTMEQFLGDLLDGLAVEHSEPERESVRLDEAVHEVVRRHKATSEERHISIVVEIGSPAPEVLGDKHRLCQVLDNLVGNAIRHMGSKADPALRIQVFEEGRSVITRVSDNGVGIPKEYQGRIFDRFFRVPKDDSQGGTGLGLAIVKKIVESHGGKIWVESDVDRGATFVFALPSAGQSG